MNIIQHLLPDNQHLPTKTTKHQVVIHHTAGNSDPIQVIDGWSADTARIATPYIIGGKSSAGDTKYEGAIVKAFDPEWDAYHLGQVPGDPKNITRTSFGIEICNWGYLTVKNGQYYNYVNKVVPLAQVIDLGFKFRGYQFWHAYTDAQVAALHDLLIALIKNRFHWTYQAKTWDAKSFDFNPAAFADDSIGTHANYRTDKWDCSPQPKLIEMLNGLNSELV